MKYNSTKVIELGSCAFRQPFADSHCRFVHGYQLKAKFWFTGSELDENNWLVDFGSLKPLKSILQGQFDHTLVVSETDPLLDKFIELNDAGGVDLRVMDGVGIEKFAEYCYNIADKHVRDVTDGRCWVEKVEVFEHECNSAIAQSGSS